ncbi:palmitoyltransferase ZDHHC12-B-like [Liolophura sinensis]|uniref:palmitoyltransferase ZDHHC12-B-like n=1 Tax=Liolophura sinensis TaxID=3198878 RepID=UPI0031580331
MICRKCRCGVNIFIRTVHTALCLGVPITLMVKDTSLSRSVLHLEEPAYGISYLGLLLLSMLMYYCACLVDPGFVPLPNKKNSVNNNSDEEAEAEDSCMLGTHKPGDCKYRRCDYCEIQQPMRTKHCEDCQRCVRKYDHHCPWLEACVGERNHKFFWLFLLTTAVLVWWTLLITWKAMAFQVEWGEWFHDNMLFILDMIVLLIGGFVVTGLLAFHTYLMSRGVTTWESVSRERITYLKYLDEDYNPFDEGIIKNIYNFLCTHNIRRWELIYSKKAEVKNSGIV